MQKIEINKKISIFSIQDRDLFTTLILSVTSWTVNPMVFMKSIC